MAKLELTAKVSEIAPDYYQIYNHGKIWRVCHKSRLQERYPDIKIIEDDLESR